MRVINLAATRGTVYTSNAFLVLGDYSTIADVNTLVDTGSDPAILEQLAKAPTGVGKRPVEQVILTHSHSDHLLLLPKIRELYNPVVYAHSAFADADVVVKDGQTIRCGDRSLEVIYTPGHSDDSICLFCAEDGSLFVGDTCVVIRSTEGTFDKRFVEALERLCRRNVQKIYFGHDMVLDKGAANVLRESLENIRIAVRKKTNRATL